MRSRVLTAVAGLAIAAPCIAGNCAEVFWATSAGGAWGDPANWTGGVGVPTAEDVAVFNISFTFDVNFVSTAGACGTSVRRGDVTFQAGAFSLLAGDTTIGTQATGPTTARVNVGNIVATSIQMGTTPGADGTLILQGGADFLCEGLTRIGTTGRATLSAADNSTVETSNTQIGSSSTGDGALLINGASAMWTDDGSLVRIGELGTGAATLTGGAAAQLPVTFVGSNSGSNGTLTLMSNSSLVSSGEVTLGGAGRGDLIMSGGSSLDATSVFFGRSSAGSSVSQIDASAITAAQNLVIASEGDADVSLSNAATIDAVLTVIGSVFNSEGVLSLEGADTALTNSTQSQIGRQGVGILDVSAGATVTNSGATSGTSTSAVVGWLAGSNGMATFSDTGTTWNCDNGFLVVGFSGAGELDVQNGAEVTSVGGFLGRNPGGNGRAIVTGAGSIWNAGAAAITIGEGPGGASGGTGALYADLSAVVSASEVVVGSGGLLGGNAGTLQAPVTNRGVVSPGAFNPSAARGVSVDPVAGLLTLGGNYTQAASGALLIELGGLTPIVQHDRLVVQGGAMIDGDLEVALIDGFDPPAGSEYVILQSFTLSGQFADELLPPFGDDRTWEVVYGDDTVTLRVSGGSEPCPGDVTGDQIVDFADLNALLVSFGQSGPDLPADLDGDMVVGFSDLNAVLVAFGTNCLP